MPIKSVKGGFRYDIFIQTQEVLWSYSQTALPLSSSMSSLSLPIFEWKFGPFIFLSQVDFT